MSQTDIDRFRRRCAQFRWLAVFMVVSVGALIALVHVISPLVLWSRGEPDHPQTFYRMMLMGLPAACYLFGVWSIGQAMGQLASGRLIQPILADALRRVGLALWIGGVLSVFVVTNVLRFVGLSTGGYLHFDVPGMTLGMIGAALFLLGRVADQAGKVQAELDEMI